MTCSGKRRRATGEGKGNEGKTKGDIARKGFVVMSGEIQSVIAFIEWDLCIFFDLEVDSGSRLISFCANLLGIESFDRGEDDESVVL